MWISTTFRTLGRIMSRVVPFLLTNVPSDPSGSPQFATTTTTTSTVPPAINLISTPKNSGITDFANFNSYIHYVRTPGATTSIQIQPSSLLIDAFGSTFYQFSWPANRQPRTSGVSTGQINNFRPGPPPPPQGQINDF